MVRPKILESGAGVKLELTGITKTFGDLVADDEVDLTVEPGEIHALLGENGAGKTTLMNVLFGLMHADSGTITIDGESVRFADPGEAVRHGVGMVHQHFMLVPVFTVAENVVLGFEPTHRFGLLDRRRARQQIRKISSDFGLEVDPDALVASLPVGIQQRVEIVKALARDAQLLILDEPTAVLTPQEIDSLFEIMRSLRESGRSILFITHKLKEVLEIADRITVMRAGKVIGTTTPSQTSEGELATMMVGRSVELVVHKRTASPGPVALNVKDLVLEDDRGVTVVDHLSFEVREGEILALAGVQGNGQTEVVRALMGLMPVTAGSVVIFGKDITKASVKQRLRLGVAHIPEDRLRDGLILQMTIADNLVLDVYDAPPHAHFGSRDLAEVERFGAEKLADFDIRAKSADELVSTLSGGNQQKVIVARELSRQTELLIASQPTRGLDVGSIEYVHRRIVEERDSGAPVLVVSSELDEVLALGDRIAVMYRGKISGIVDPSVGREKIGLLMAGIAEGAEADEAASVTSGAGA
jgi:general nucleoside transport system ATP-binding protein